MSLRSVIVGCGRIAGGFNENDETRALSHVVALKQLGAEVAGCCDVDAAKARHFAQRWDIPEQGTNLAAVLKSAEPHLVCVCTPPDQRLPIIELALAHSTVRSLLVEKPVAASASAAREIMNLVRQSGRPMLVNFFRAFDPFHAKLETEYRSGALGVFKEGTARYYGNAWANASHWIERALALFGRPDEAERLGGSPAAPLFMLTFNDGRLVFLPAEGVEYAPFELDLLLEKRRIRIIDSERRVECFESKPDPEYPGYYNLSPSDLWQGLAPEHGSLEPAMQALIDAARMAAQPDYALLERSVAVVELLEQLNIKP